MRQYQSNFEGGSVGVADNSGTRRFGVRGVVGLCKRWWVLCPRSGERSEGL